MGLSQLFNHHTVNTSVCQEQEHRGRRKKRIRRVRQDFSTTYEDFVGSIFQPCEMTSYIRAVIEQIAIKIFSLPNRKISLRVISLCATWVQSCPNPVDTSTTWKNLRSFLSIIGRMQWAEKLSHTTVPLSSCWRHSTTTFGPFQAGAWWRGETQSSRSLNSRISSRPLVSWPGASSCQTSFP